MFSFPKRALLAAMLIATPVLAAPHASVHVEDAWCPPTPPGAPTAAGYLTIRNLGPSSDRLVGGSSPVATQVQLHSMTMTGGVMRMRQASAGLLVAAGATAHIQPGDGLHLMLIGLRRPLHAGEHLPITLEFARAGAVRADFVVRPQFSATGGERGHMDHMAHMGGR